MITIREFLNKIKWDKNLDPDDYTIYYHDNKLNKIIEIDFKQIKEIDTNFMVIERDSKEVDIPLHIVTAVRKKGKLVWARTR